MLSLLVCAAFAAKKKTVIKLSPEFAEWVYEYVSSESNDKSKIQAILKISNHYNTLPTAEQDKARGILEDLTNELIKSKDYDAVFSIIDLYDNVVSDNTKKNPKIYYAKGHLNAELYEDTIKVKEAIQELRQCVDGEAYIELLEKKIENIRNYIPADKGLEGYWVSDALSETMKGGGLNTIEIPKYIITAKEENGKPYFTITSNSPFLWGTCITTKLLFSDTYLQPQKSQKLYAFTRDSISVTWSSDKLKNYDAELVGLSREATRTTAALASASLAQRNKHSFAERLVGNLAVSAAEVGINSLIDTWTAPTKKVYVLQGFFRKGNDNIYIGDMRYVQVLAKEGQIPKTFEDTEKISLLRWTKESGVIFMSFKGYPLTPYETSNTSIKKQKEQIEKQKKKNEKIIKENEAAEKKCKSGTVPKKKRLIEVDEIIPCWKDIRDDATTEYGKAYLECKNSKDKTAFITEWNRKQIMKLRNYDANH